MYAIDTPSSESLLQSGQKKRQDSRRNTSTSHSFDTAQSVENVATNSCGILEQRPALRERADAGCNCILRGWRAQRSGPGTKVSTLSSEASETGLPPEAPLKYPLRPSLRTRSPSTDPRPLPMVQTMSPKTTERVDARDSLHIHHLQSAGQTKPTTTTLPAHARTPPMDSFEKLCESCDSARSRESYQTPKLQPRRSRRQTSTSQHSQNSQSTNMKHPPQCERPPAVTQTRARARIMSNSRNQQTRTEIPDPILAPACHAETPESPPLLKLPPSPPWPPRHHLRPPYSPIHRPLPLDISTPAGSRKLADIPTVNKMTASCYLTTERQELPEKSSTDLYSQESQQPLPPAPPPPSPSQVVNAEESRGTSPESISALRAEVWQPYRRSGPAIAAEADSIFPTLTEGEREKHVVTLKRSGRRQPVLPIQTSLFHLLNQPVHSEELDHHTPSTDSPISLIYSGSDGEELSPECDTPFTTPCTSPNNSRPHSHRFPPLDLSRAQLDGADRDLSEDNDLIGFESGEEDRFARLFDGRDFPRESKHTARPYVPQGVPARRAVPDLKPPERNDDLNTVDECAFADDVTPLAQASKAKGAETCPFPVLHSSRLPVALLSAQRHPSALLPHCERNATPRQRRLMASTLESPDRFIPARTHTPTKEALFTRNIPKKETDPLSPVRRTRNLPDPFGPGLSHGPRVAERFATIRRPPPTNRPPGGAGTALTPNGGPSNRRAVSTGAVWTVRGTIVTEGVASVSNGRGGRITSSTSAPHYTSDFLHRQSPSEEKIVHGQRLAVAMDVDETASMFADSSPLSAPSASSSGRRAFSDSSRRKTFWNNNCWESETVFSSAKQSKQKPKAIPVVPFRVLDAPFLRDDYYCSLLAYSNTLQCLAVSLGRHVYLWSESLGGAQPAIPSSLTSTSPAHVTSLSFSSVEGGSAILAIGRANGGVTLWSPQDDAPRFDSLQPSPVSCVCFRPNAVKRQSVREECETAMTEELLVGDEMGIVYYYSVEWPTPDKRDLFDWQGSLTLIAKVTCHSQQVCGLAWSREGEYFATGGNDNQLFVFETRKLFSKSWSAQSSPTSVRNGNAVYGGAVDGQGDILAITHGHHKHLFTLNAAVKAISFAPWQSSLIAAGGGSNDRCIHFFHALSGATLATIDCHAQVTSLVWSEKRKEIAATFGFAQPEHPYRIAVFAWPSCRRVVGIPWWSEERALYAVAYPGGPSGGGVAAQRTRDTGQTDGEGRSWSSSRTRDEGCLVIATSNASIKFHEVWAEKGEGSGKGRDSGGILGGSPILEDSVSPEVERSAIIR